MLCLYLFFLLLGCDRAAPPRSFASLVLPKVQFNCGSNHKLAWQQRCWWVFYYCVPSEQALLIFRTGGFILRNAHNGLL